MYSSTFYGLNLVSELEESQLSENSGLISLNNSLWSINDGGNTTSIYQLDTSGNILREVTVTNVENTDWEAITQNDSHIFIGDFGNNLGSRQNLNIITINKADLLDTSIETVQGQESFFRYEDQLSFSWPLNGHNFDCEAFVAFSDSLFLFTKNWEDGEVNRYALPTLWSGEEIANRVESYNIGGLVTDAAIDLESGKLILLGYNDAGTGIYSSFVCLLWDYEFRNVFSGHKRRIEIGSMLSVGQTEGLTMNSPYSGFISSEQISSIITIPPKLFAFDFQLFFSPTLGLTSFSTNATLLSPNPVYQTLKVSQFSGAYQIHTYNGVLLRSGFSLDGFIDVQHLTAGQYFLKLQKTSYLFIKR